MPQIPRLSSEGGELATEWIEVFQTFLETKHNFLLQDVFEYTLEIWIRKIPPDFLIVVHKPRKNKFNNACYGFVS